MISRQDAKFAKVFFFAFLAALRGFSFYWLHSAHQGFSLQIHHTDDAEADQADRDDFLEISGAEQDADAGKDEYQRL